jgi:hypothetical protein
MVLVPHVRPIQRSKNSTRHRKHDQRNAMPKLTLTKSHDPDHRCRQSKADRKNEKRGNTAQIPSDDELRIGLLFHLSRGTMLA